MSHPPDQNPAMALETQRLTPYLEQHIDGFRGPIHASKFSQGQSNPTYRIDTPTHCCVLRRKPPGELLKSAHAIDREFKVMQALQCSDVPVARAYHLCSDDSIIGSMFYIMEFVSGRVLWDPALPDMTNEQRAAHYDAMNAVLASVHSVDVEQVGLATFGRAQGYLSRQLALWSRQYTETETSAIPAMDWLLDHLAACQPPEDNRLALVHGDFRLDNMLFHPTEPSVLALVDWELSTLGHPFTDLAYQCMQWRMPHQGLMSGLAGVDRAALGIPEEQAYVERYCERMGIDGIAHWNFYVAFSAFRFASILQGVKKRALAGNASSEQALAMGEYVQPLADMAREILDQ